MAKINRHRIDIVEETQKTLSTILRRFPEADKKLSLSPAGFGVKVNLQKSIEIGLDAELAEKIKAEFPMLVI